MQANEPIRRCILSGERDDRVRLIRLALSPDGIVLPDVAARAPGRGAWLAPDRAALEKAISGNKLKAALSRAFKTGNVGWPDDLPNRIALALQRQTLDRLGLEARAGHLATGADRIGDAIAAGRACMLLHAADAAEDGRRKLDGRMMAVRGVKGLCLPVGRAELSLALGRENVVHAALVNQAAASRVAATLQRWCAYMGLNEQRSGTCESASQGASPVETLKALDSE